MHRLVDLCIGRLAAASTDESDHVAALRALRTAIETTISDLKDVVGRMQEPSSCRLGAMLGRRLFEQCTLAILGRLDPVRLVAAFKGPSSADFKLGDRNDCSFHWARDILPEFAGASVAWNQSTLRKGLVRGLLDGHLATFLFDSSHGRLLDALVHHYATRKKLPTWVLEVQKFDEGLPLLSQLRSRAGTAYSSLSKGIHFEFLGPGITELSPADLAAGLDSALFVASTTAVLSHLSGICVGPLAPHIAISRFSAVAAYSDAHLKAHIR